MCPLLRNRTKVGRESEETVPSSNDARKLLIVMADNQLLNDNGGDGGDIFVYTGREQRVPLDVKRVRIAENADTIPARKFSGCRQLIEVEGHDKLKKIEEYAFYCPSLRCVRRMTCVVEIEKFAFYNCSALSELELDKLEIIRDHAFAVCRSLRSINMSSIRSVETYAFQNCDALTDVVFGAKLERIEGYAFHNCTSLRRIVIPLKDNLTFVNSAFSSCGNLSRADALDGEIHKTISSLHLESWRNEMEDEIDRINQTLPNIRIGKTRTIQQWLTRVFSRMEHYKGEHQTLLKEAMTLLELALWKAKLLNQTDVVEKCSVDIMTKNTKIDNEAARKEHRVTCGASIVIKNVLPFLALK